MKARFSTLLALLGWYRRILLEGPSHGLRAYCLRERVREGRGEGRDLALGEEALTLRRIRELLSTLSPRECELLLGNDPQRLGLSSRNALYKRQHALRRRLTPRFIEAGLVEAQSDMSHQEVIP